MQKRLSSLLAAMALLPGLALAHGPAPRPRPSPSPTYHPSYRPHSSVNFGVSVGTGFYYPGYYNPYWYGPPVIYPAPVYSSPPVVIQSQPPVYIERPAATAEAPASAYWYYCAPTQSYYPYVNECSEAWQPVSPTPPTPQATPVPKQ